MSTSKPIRAKLDFTAKIINFYEFCGVGIDIRQKLKDCLLRCAMGL